jgi:hypothetical protein
MRSRSSAVITGDGASSEHLLVAALERAVALAKWIALPCRRRTPELDVAGLPRYFLM